jgi:hypothetical protein
MKEKTKKDRGIYENGYKEEEYILSYQWKITVEIEWEIISFVFSSLIPFFLSFTIFLPLSSSLTFPAFLSHPCYLNVFGTHIRSTYKSA